jgi:glycosyltransferase involved in cell wall biosynthesis
MNFLHLSAADHGGAGIAAWRMHQGLRALGHESRLVVLEGRTGDRDVQVLGKESRGFRLRRLARKASLKLGSRPDYYFQDQALSLAPDPAQACPPAGTKPDLIVVHSISHFLGATDVQALQQATGAPVVWHLLDMALMTGGCHYAWRCEGYTRGCGACPALRWHGIGQDLSARIWQGKSLAMGRTRGWVVAGSSLLARQASRSSLLGGRRIETLLLGVSPTIFMPRDAVALREKFGVAGAERVIFFGAQKFNQRRKGMHLLLQALLRLADAWPADTALPVLLSAGNASDFAPLRQRGYRMVDLGFVGTETLAQAYAAADVFACPSIEDSGPMMVNEAMMSGTPVVAFRMGVAEDLIDSGANGIIAELGDFAAFAAGLRSVLLWSTPQRTAARESCRHTALEKCLPDRQLAHFVEIAGALLAQGGGAA